MTPRTAIVTGAAGTIGLGAVTELVAAGRRVAMVDLHQERLKEAAAAFPPGQVVPVAVDICAAGAPTAIDAAIAAAGWNPATILVNNAGISPRTNGVAAGLFDVTQEEWLKVYEVNVTAGFMLARQVVPHMLAAQWGRIVNVSSRAARSNVVSAGPAYTITKAAVLGMTRWLACEYAAQGITCNSIAPGAVLSHMVGQLSPEKVQRLMSATPVGRAGTATELGASIAFLASEHAGFITGICLDVNGGQPMI